MVSDTIVLERMQFYGYHGGRSEERTLGQPFEVDLEAELDLRVAGKSDDLENTVNYTQLYKIVKEVMEGRPRNLLESLAEEIADRSLSAFPIDGIRVRVKKTRPPIQGSVISGASVEIYRSKR